MAGVALWKPRSCCNATPNASTRPSTRQLAEEINNSLQQVADNRGRLNSQLISQLNLLLQRLSRTGLRHGDRFEQTVLPPLRKPVYLALQHIERADRNWPSAWSSLA